MQDIKKPFKLVGDHYLITDENKWVEFPTEQERREYIIENNIEL